MRGRRILLSMVVLLMSVLVQRATVMAHAKFLRSAPAAGSTVKAAPKVVRVWFTLAAASEELDPKRSTLSVWDSRGRRVDDGKGGVDLNDLDRKSMLVNVKPLAPGTYTVRWKAVSTPDLEATQGAFLFTILPPR